MKPSVQKLADQIAADPSASFFLKEAVKKSLQRDPLDALRDAETLVALLADNAGVVATAHPILFNRITTLGSAKEFLAYLYNRGMSYHCEDDAADCIGHLLTTEECYACCARMEECYKQDFGDSCPCGFVLSLDPEYNCD